MLFDLGGNVTARFGFTCRSQRIRLDLVLRNFCDFHDPDVPTFSRMTAVSILRHT
jgi:hypothetical protein